MAAGPLAHLELRPRGYELGPDGRVPLPTLARWLEHARWSTVEEESFGFRRFLPRGVVRAECVEVRAPVGYGDVVTVASWIGRIGTTSFEFRQRATGHGGETVALARTVVVVLGDGGPAPIPDVARELIRHEELEGAPLTRVDPTGAMLTERFREVAPSDLDLFGHMNHAKWIEHAEDVRAAAFRGAAATSGARLERASADFRREARLGDTLFLQVFTQGPQRFGVEVRVSDGTIAATVDLHVSPGP